MPRLRWFFFDHKASQVRNSFEQPPKKTGAETPETTPEIQTSWQPRNSHQAKIANFKTLEPILKAPEAVWWETDPKAIGLSKVFLTNMILKIVLVPGQVTRFAWRSCLF